MLLHVAEVEIASVRWWPMECEYRTRLSTVLDITSKWTSVAHCLQVAAVMGK